LTKSTRKNYSLGGDLIRVAVRFFSGVPHPHLLGVCCPNPRIFIGALTHLLKRGKLCDVFSGEMRAMNFLFSISNSKAIRSILLAACALPLAGQMQTQAAQLTPPPLATNSPAVPAKPNPLVWDAMDKTVEPAPGDARAEFSFWVTNSGTAEVVISNVQPSCGCTTPTLPPMPWKLVPGTNGQIKASVDIKGKSGNLVKTLTVMSSAGFQTLSLRINIGKDPIQQMAERQANMERSKVDAQAVFKGSCASCHFAPLVNKMGEDLFVTGCAICHEPFKWAENRHEVAASHHRAEMVPDLTKLSHPMPKALWKVLITNGGGQGKLMPAFFQKHGGPLTEAQIDSLVEYASKRFKFDPTNIPKAAALR
jgi:mono/diheme cytochrome c family protein